MWFAIIAFVCLAVYSQIRDKKPEIKKTVKRKVFGSVEEDTYISDGHDEHTNFPNESYNVSMQGQQKQTDYVIYKDDLNRCLRDIQNEMLLNDVKSLFKQNPNLSEYYIVSERQNANGTINCILEWYMIGTSIGFRVYFKGNKVVGKEVIK